MLRPLHLRVLSLLLACAALAPLGAHANYRQYLIAWQSTSFRSQESCLDVSGLYQEGQANFHVNNTPLPTYTLPGHFKRHSGGDETNLYGAQFSAVLLNWGNNTFRFNVHVVDSPQTCVVADDIVTLETGGLTARPLFLVQRRGTAYAGQTTLTLDLSEINPRLAENLVNLERVLQDRKWQLLSIHGSLAAAQAELDRLAELKGEIDELSKRPLDAITEADLNDILSRYSDLDPRVLSQLRQLLSDLKEDIAALRTELNRIMSEFRGQMSGLDDWLAGTPPANAPNLEDPKTYEPGLDPDQLPEVELPDLGVGDDFDPDNDPYLAYAQQVLQQLATTTQGGVVVNRAGYMTIVRSWRQNQDIFEKAIQARASVSREEVGAFISARDLVLDEVRLAMDEDGWFLDTPVRQSTKSLIEYLRQRPEARHQADGLQSNLNLWHGTATPQQDAILDTLDGLHGGWQSVEEGAAAEDPSIISTLLSIGDSAQVIIKEVALLGVGMTPAGDFIDFCEVATGWETCMPGGAQLSTGERMFTALGMVVGTGRFWRGVGNALPTVSKPIADRCETLIKRWSADIPNKTRREELVERLGEDAVAFVDGLDGKDVERLLNTLGDATVRKLAKHLEAQGLRELELFKMLQIPDAKRLHAVSNGRAVKDLGTMKGKTLADLKAALKAKGFREVTPGNWVHDDCSVVRISPGVDGKPPYFRREISMVPGKYEGHDTIAVKVTGAMEGNDDIGYTEVFSLPEWAEPYIGVSTQMNKWFARFVGKDPKDLGEFGPELLAIKDYWVKQTHFDLEP
ncbi:hypothetical protein NVS55_37375 [Myxococcus stipitatus]|uniref:hypothetical protein n=1 Tax=Myxococcus stipitatus TaxID=83455 RepID=UPI00314504E0